MHVALTPNQRLIRLSAGNVRNGHISVRGHRDFLPSDAIGGANRAAEARPIELTFDGLGETVFTDVARDKGIFRCRSEVRRFFACHGITAANVGANNLVVLEHLGARRYRIGAPNSTHSRQFTAAEFFAGIGLVRLALEKHDWNIVFSNDIDPDKAEMYRHNWPNDDHLHVGDIHHITPEMIPTCDLFTASFPCNDLSIAGRRDGLNGKESSAFWGLVEIVKRMKSRQPGIILLENVVGFLTSHDGADFETVLRTLNNLGYSVDAVILNATHWTPQSRARLFVIAQLDIHKDRRTTPVDGESGRPPALAKFIMMHPDIRWNLRTLPPLPPAKSKLKDIIEDLPAQDPHWWSRERAEYFVSQFSDRHADFARRMIEGDRYSYATAFRRVRLGRSMAELRSDDIAGCLRTPRGGSGRQILFKAGRGNYSVRLLTARECARLQGVPDSYVIDVPLNQALFGFGDAVCVPVVAWLAEHYLNPICGELTLNAI